MKSNKLVNIVAGAMAPILALAPTLSGCYHNRQLPEKPGASIQYDELRNLYNSFNPEDVLKIKDYRTAFREFLKKHPDRKLNREEADKYLYNNLSTIMNFDCMSNKDILFYLHAQDRSALGQLL